jgi:hypothetical protein
VAILTCPGCGRGGLRIPDGRRGKVTCPRCGAEWFHPETVELSEVEFRCSQSGARFIVQLSRRFPLHNFVVQAIKAAPAPHQSKTVGQDNSVSPKASFGNHAAAAQQPPAPRRPKGWLARLFVKTATAPSAATSSAVVDNTEAEIPNLAVSACHDAGEYNWASFFCPYCNAPGFIRCGGGHFSCDGTAEMRSGRRFHQCFCGSAGFIEGTIKTIEANQSTLTVKPTAPKFSAGANTDAIEKPKDSIALPLMTDNHKKTLP